MFRLFRFIQSITPEKGIVESIPSIIPNAVFQDIPEKIFC